MACDSPALKAKNVVTLVIDGSRFSFGTGTPGISNTDTNDPLYVGSSPSKSIQIPFLAFLLPEMYALVLFVQSRHQFSIL